MRPHDATGLVEFYAEKRRKYDGLAYKAPVIVAPEPIRIKLVDDAERTKLIGQIERLKADLSAAVAENLKLQEMVAGFRPHNVPTSRAPIAILAVQTAFCETMISIGRAVDDGSSWTLEHLKAPGAPPIWHAPGMSACGCAGRFARRPRCLRSGVRSAVATTRRHRTASAARPCTWRAMRTCTWPRSRSSSGSTALPIWNREGRHDRRGTSTPLPRDRREPRTRSP